MPKSDAAPDAVVIGAGHNGLVAANLLADAGWSVLVCEATEFTGGAVRTAEVTAPGFRSDVFSAFYPLAFASPVIQRLDLPSYGLEWSRAPAVLAHVFPDGEQVVLSHDVEATAASVATFHSADADSWRQVVDEWREISDVVLAALFAPFPPVAPSTRLALRLKTAGLARFARFLTLPVRRFGDERFGGRGAPILFAGNAMHADIPVDAPGSAAFGWLMTMVAQQHGFPVPRGGASRLIDAMVTRLRARGGEVRTSTPVERVELKAGQATGVRLQDGTLLAARRAVLADVNAPTLYHRLVGDEHLPAKFVEYLRDFEWDPPTVKLDWALSRPVPWRAAEVRSAGTVHLGADMNGLTTFAADIARRRIPQEPFVLFGQMTTSDTSRSPAGTEAAWAYSHLPHDIELSDTQVREVVERIENVVERQAPGFRDSIVGRFVQAPGQLQDHDPNLVGGAINGGTAQLHQEAVFRPTIGLGGAVTPIDRLYLAGSSAHPGGGVHGGPGSNAAHAALARTGITGPARRAATRAVLSRLYR